MTNHSLAGLGGTESWTYTMAQELARRGHSIEVLTFVKGESSDRLESIGITVHNTPLQTAPADVILVNHNTCLGWVQDLSGFKIFTSHGPTHRLEQPAIGADAYVAVSQEVLSYNAALGFYSTVIPNGIDLEDFEPYGKKDLDRVLILCKDEFAGEIARKASERAGKDYEIVHYIKKPRWSVSMPMNRAGILIGCGRTAIEGLAMNCEVVVFDKRGTNQPQGDGRITKDNVSALAEFNFSTRSKNLALTESLLAREISLCSENTWGRRWVEENRNIKQTVERYLDLVPESIKEKENEFASTT